MKQKNALEKIIREYLNEQKKLRRNKTIFRVIYVLLFIALIYFVAKPSQLLLDSQSMYGDSGNPGDEHVAVIKIVGPIMDASMASADKINELLERAFAAEMAKAVILELNTPGGSPVQADRIAETIVRLRAQHEGKPVYAVVSDVCASGGMYIAAVSDAIYVNRASIVGSIGVIFSGFGFVEMIDKIGVERRLMTAGKNKGMLDPFTPLKEKDKEHAQVILDEIHKQFIQRVRSGRGDRLSDNEELFSGLFWTGEQAKKIGLVDDFGDSQYVAREIAKLDNVIEYEQRKDIFEKFSGVMADTLETRLQSLLLSIPGLR